MKISIYWWWKLDTFSVTFFSHRRHSIKSTRHWQCVGTDRIGSGGGWLLQRRRSGWVGSSWRMVHHWWQFPCSSTSDERCCPLTKIRRKWNRTYRGHGKSGDDWWIFWIGRERIGERQGDFMGRWCKRYFCLGQRRGYWPSVWRRASRVSTTGRYGGGRSWSPDGIGVGHGCTHPLGRRWKQWVWMRSGCISPAARTRPYNTLWLVLSWKFFWRQSGSCDSDFQGNGGSSLLWI